jgi:drug/metabolite transporter (DMT)-like permease
VALLVALGVCLGVVLGTGQWVNPAPPWDRADLALLVSSALHGLIYATYVGLAARAGAVFATQTSYIVTLAGICWAMLLLGERFSPFVWVAAAVMLLGISLVRPRPALV